MSTITVVVPKFGKQSEIDAYEYDVSTVLDAGNDLLFKDENGYEVNMQRINLAVDGTIKCRSAGGSDGSALTPYYSAGGWHTAPISKFFADGTDLGLKIIARLS